MGKLSARKKAVKRTVGIGNVAFAAVSHVEDLDARIETIQLLIPLGLQALTDELQRLSSSTVSRRYVKATARKLAQFQERSLEDYDLVALLLDGKSFADEQIIIALGVTLDGAKGLYKAVMSVLKEHACVQRCQYHKRKNVVSYLPKCEQDRIRRKMEAAYAKPTYEGAKKALIALKPELELMNQSALNSLEEGMEETLTLHRLGLMPTLGQSFRTTNCIENVNSLLQQLTHNVRRWTNSAQRHRWVATALLDIEPRLRRIKGCRHLPMLRQALQAELGTKQLAKAS